MSNFGNDLRAFAQSTQIRFDKVVRKVGYDLVSDLVRLTPVDTGLARSNYFCGYQRDNSINEGTAMTSGAPSIGGAATFVATLKAGGVFYITNNLPYIMKLEYGSSKQAPSGMARITVDAWQQRVNKIVAAL
jgi:hypothetical protein